MKLQQIFLAALFAGFASMAVAETGYVGAGNGGPLYSNNGCVQSNNDQQFAECGEQEESKKEPEVVIKVITDCSKCDGKQPKQPQ